MGTVKMKVKIMWGLAMVPVIFLFQNCAQDLVPLESTVEFASLSEAMNSLDSEALPRLFSSDKFSYWKQNGQLRIAESPLFAEAGSATLSVRRDAQGPVFSVHSGSQSQESLITISGNKIRAVHFSDESNYSFIESTIPIGTSEYIVVAASFGKDPNQISLLINGIKQRSAIQKVGTPTEYSYLLKTVESYGIENQTSEIRFFKSKLSDLDLNALSRNVASDNGIPGVQFDSSLLGTSNGPEESVGPTPQFLAAKSVIDAKCLSCHSSDNFGNFQNLTQAQFIQKGFVIPKNLAASRIYYRLSGATTGPGPRNMPQGTTMTQNEVEIIATWINSIE